MTLGQHLDREVDFEGLARWIALELLAKLVRHLHILEHDLKALRELAPTLFLELENESSLGFFADLALFKQALCKATDIEALENILIEQIAENMYDLVQAFGQFCLLNILEVFLEHLI